MGQFAAAAVPECRTLSDGHRPGPDQRGEACGQETPAWAGALGEGRHLDIPTPRSSSEEPVTGWVGSLSKGKCLDLLRAGRSLGQYLECSILLSPPAGFGYSRHLVPGPPEPRREEQVLPNRPRGRHPLPREAVPSEGHAAPCLLLPVLPASLTGNHVFLNTAAPELPPQVPHQRGQHAATFTTWQPVARPAEGWM